MQPTRRNPISIKQDLSDADREAIRRDIIEGCPDMADVYLEIEREMHPLSEEAFALYESCPEWTYDS